MVILIDTCVLVRLADLGDPLYSVADRAIVELHRRGETPYITGQNLVEFRSVATRPKTANGLGLTVVETETKAAAFEAKFPLLTESPAFFPAWKALTAAVGVIGKRVHDARLVAICHVHNVTHLLTFNVGDFTPMQGFGPGIIVVDPASV